MLASSLPPELYTAILNQVSHNDLQKTALALTRALPHSPIPIYLLFEHIHLKRAEQVIQLHRRLRGAAEDASSVREFALEMWTVDADVVVNLIRLLPRLTSLTLFVGPNFAPEHMEEIFAKPIAELQFISLRFRPYVQRATYYQFLKGAYFDSMLFALSDWPACKLPILSIVQDPLDPDLAQKQTFAQPLVFFRLDPFTTLVRSEYLDNLRNFRLRIPSRQISRFICAIPGSLPALELLDLSTCNVLESEVDTLLIRFPKLRHLVLDGCSLLRGELREGEWASLGKSIALAGVQRAKQRGKKLKAWLEANSIRSASLNNNNAIVVGLEPDGQVAARRARRGRRGLATATISLRASPPRDSTTLPDANALPPGVKVAVPKIRILPSSPSLTSLATTTSSLVMPDKHPIIRAEFERGWAEGLTQLTATRERLRQSWTNGIRVVCFADDSGASEEGLDGLVDVSDEMTFRLVNGQDGLESLEAPVLCLSGPRDSDLHVDGCGHKVGRDTWNDGI